MVQVCGASENVDLPPNFIKLAKDAYTPDIIAASDCMLGQYEICVTANLDLTRVVLIVLFCYFRKNWIWHC